MIKVERKKEQLIKELNSFELSLLITELIEYKEGVVTVQAMNSISKYISEIKD